MPIRVRITAEKQTGERLASLFFRQILFRSAGSARIGFGPPKGNQTILVWPHGAWALGVCEEARPGWSGYLWKRGPVE